MKRFLSLLLVLALCVGMVSVASADETKKVTLSILGHYHEFNHKLKSDGTPDYNDCPDYLVEWYEYIKYNLIPGYEVTIKWIIYEDPQDQIPLLLAANDVPDIVVAEKNTWREYIDTGFFLTNLDPYLEQYGQDILANTEARSREMCKIDGHLAVIPSENTYYKFPTIIRTDWLENVGIEYKDTYTLSEFKEICLAFATQDPDGDGKNDTFGIGARYNGGDWQQTFMPVLGAFNGQMDHFYLDEETNEVYAYNYSDDFRAAIAYIADLYQAGAVDTEVFVLNYEQAKIKAATGVAGVYSGWWNVVGNLLDAGLLQIQPEARLNFIYITSDDGQTEGVLDNGTIWKTAMVSADCEYPEVAIAFINYFNKVYDDRVEGQGNDMLLDENGKYVIDENGYAVYKSVSWQALVGTNDETTMYQAGWRAIPTANLFNNMTKRWQGLNAQTWAEMPEGDPNDPAVYTTKEWQQAYRNYLNGIGDRMNANPMNKPVYTDLFYGLEAPIEALDYGAGLQTQRTTWFVDFVTGVKDVNDDAQWAAYCNDGVKKGAQKLMDAYLAIYNEASGTSYTARPIGK